MLALAFPGLHTARSSDRVGRVRAQMLGRRFDCADVAVLDGDKLVGVVPVRRLLEADGEQRLEEVMDADPPVVGPGAEPEEAAWAVAGTRQAREAAEERVSRRLWHRLPWLLIGLIGAMALALVVGAFEAQLERNVLLALFVPAVVYIAGAVAMQTQTVLIRGLSAGIGLRDVVWRESASGLAIGVIVALVFFGFVVGAWGDSRVALAVGLSLMATCAIATAVAMALPWALQRIGSDPAFGSGPLATVIQDILSVTVYLAIAASIAL